MPDAIAGGSVQPVAEPGPPSNGNIVIVDDSRDNRELLEDLLHRQGYEVRSFPRGRLALAAVHQEPPDLILLDINMPEMNGYEVCERLKSSPRLSGVPVIFLSALDALEDKVKGFQSGGADYISKPFQSAEVQARVETQIKLRCAQKAEREVLEKTVNGVVGTIWELIQLTSPGLALRSGAIRDIVLFITEKMDIQDAWQYELAATLCLVGCITLPEEVFEKAHAGQDLSPDEDQMFRAHPERGAHLLSKIPRLQVVAEMIRMQQKVPTKSAMDGAAQGAHMLHLALELNQRLHRGTGCQAAVRELKSLNQYDDKMMDALESYSPAKTESELQTLRIRDIRPGMILDEDVFSMNGKVLMLKAGTVLTETWLERLENFAKLWRIEAVRVRIPTG